MPNEIDFSTRTHPKVLFVPVFILAIIVTSEVFLIQYFPEVTNDFLKWTKIVANGFLGILFLGFVIRPIILWYVDTFEIKTKTVLAHEGIFYRNHEEILVERISQIKIERGLLDLIFGSGTIKMYDASNTLGLVFKDVPRVNKVKELIDEARRNSSN